MDCKDIYICNETVMLRAYVQLMLGRAEDVIEKLEEMNRLEGMRGQADAALIQAYQMTGQIDKAVSHTQVSIYTHLISLIEASTWYLRIRKDNPAACEETIRRTDAICAIYEVDRLLSNSAALFQLEAAVFYSMCQKKDQAMERIEHYARIIEWMLEGDHLESHGDTYFDTIGKWYDGLELGGSAPRDKKIIRESAVQGLLHPAFDCIREKKEFQKVLRNLKEEHYE